MWVLLIVSLIVGTFAFEMQLEARIISAQRKRFQADQLALGGVELAKSMLFFEEDEEAGEDIIYDDPYLSEASKIADAVPVRYTETLSNGTVTITIDYEKGRRNIHKMTADEWKELFDQTGIPSVDWESLLGCLTDWQDEGDTHQLNGAESDDPFYRERGYECKNAPVDTVDELLLIKGWTEEILYGTPPGRETESPTTGLARYLTVWGGGKVNPNSAGREVLNSLPIPLETVEAILELRTGLDGEAGTQDDGLTQADFDALGLSSDLFTLKPEYVSISSVGTVGDLESRISCIFKLGAEEAVPVFWQEGKQEEKRR